MQILKFDDYIKGSKIHESINRIDQNKLNYVFGENMILFDSWYKLNLEIKKRGIKYRNVEITESLVFRNRRSKVRLIS